jgi:hypothetical protein
LENTELGRTFSFFRLSFLVRIVVVETHANFLLALVLDASLGVPLLLSNFFIFFHHILELGNYFLLRLSLRQRFEHFFSLTPLFSLVLQSFSVFCIFFLLFSESLCFLSKSLFLFSFFARNLDFFPLVIR